MSQLSPFAITGQDLAQWTRASLPQGSTQLAVEAVGLPAPGPSLLELECGVFLQGQQSGLLLLRCGRTLAANMAEAVAGRALARLQARQALQELTERLAQTLLQAGLFGQPPQATAKPGQELRVWDWPPMRPTLECLLMVGEQPVELRLWMERPGA